jgi:EAL domain-containing protein (putative c-di-GMP-specific phosphodiesterase class I)
MLQTLSDAGVRLSIDDFGTGYSSLSYLSRLALDELKIDKSFVMRMVHDSRDASIVQSTIGLGHALGLSVVAEGVEDEETLGILAKLGCDIGQGYHISLPLRPDKLQEWLRDRRAVDPDPAASRAVVASGSDVEVLAEHRARRRSS